MRSLAGELPTDSAAIQTLKEAEFHSLGLVLGYSYAGSPVVAPGAGPRGPVEVTRYRPSTEPGARLPHRWLADGSSLYDRLGPAFSLVGPVRANGRGVAELVDRAHRLGIPLSLVEPPPPLSASSEAGDFLLVRPDQHIADRAANAADLDLELAVGHHSRLSPPRSSASTTAA